MEHVAELRRRLFFIVLSIAVWSIAAYAVEHTIIDILLRPAHGQDFIYTSPIGGMNFLFKVCIYVGIAFSIPVIVYQFLRYIEPLMKHESARFIRLGSLASGVLAVAGMVFGYFVGLPAALHFLLNQFHTEHINPLLSIEAYLAFVTMYMLGAALMFQVPLIVLFINRIKPLTPQQLFRKERWVIVFSVVLGLIMNPTPNLLDQMFVIIPMILSYQLSIGIIWLHNRKLARVERLRAEDVKLRSERLRRVQDLGASWQTADALATEAETGPITTDYTQAKPAAAFAGDSPSASHEQVQPASPGYTRRTPQAVRPRPLRGRYIQ